MQDPCRSSVRQPPTAAAALGGDKAEVPAHGGLTVKLQLQLLKFTRCKIQIARGR